MERGLRICPECGSLFCKFYIQEEPSKGKPFYTVVFICEIPECKHEWVEPIYEYRVLRKIKSDRYREHYDDIQVRMKAEDEQKNIEFHKKRRQVEEMRMKGLSDWEIRKKLKLKIRKIGQWDNK